MYIQPSIATLDALIGKNISEICLCGYTDDAHNHCAHFVSHVAGYQFGYTCFNQTGKGKREDRANLRVQEVFAQCGSVGLFESKAVTLTSGLIFITDERNVNTTTKVMENVPRKHIGFFHGDMVWHYSNSRDQVVSQVSSHFSKHYSGDRIKMFYGEFPQ